MILAISLCTLLYKFELRSLALYVFILIGSILPDIDHPESLIGRYNILAPVECHRGFTHTFLGSIVFTLPLIFFGLKSILGLWIGYIFHLILDTFNPAGIMWFYPWKKKHYHLSNFPVGGPEEAVLFLGSILLLFS